MTRSRSYGDRILGACEKATHTMYDAAAVQHVPSVIATPVQSCQGS